jgi:hypothetical protein
MKSTPDDKPEQPFAVDGGELKSVSGPQKRRFDPRRQPVGKVSDFKPG